MNHDVQAKTKETDNSVIEFIESVDHPKKREDAYTLLDILLKRQVMKPKCGDRALLDLVRIIINMLQDMKAMPAGGILTPKSEN